MRAFLASSFRVASSFSISIWSFSIFWTWATMVASAVSAFSALEASGVRRNEFTRLEHSKKAWRAFEIWNAAFMSPCVFAWPRSFSRSSAITLAFGPRTFDSTATWALWFETSSAKAAL